MRPCFSDPQTQLLLALPLLMPEDDDVSTRNSRRLREDFFAAKLAAEAGEFVSTVARAFSAGAPPEGQSSSKMAAVIGPRRAVVVD